MRLLGVTGSSGLIGTALVKLARVRGYDLRLFSRDAAVAVPLDLGVPELDPELFLGCDAIIHLAARLPSPIPDLAEARECWEINALGTLKLMDAMHSAGVRRLIQATAANAYAPWCEYPDETASLYPVSKSLYLGSKVLQELYAHGCASSHEIEVTSLRISSPYGPSPRSIVGRMAGSLLKGQPIRVDQGGAFGADFIHVEDVARAILLIESLRTDGIWNIGTGRRTTILDIAMKLAPLTDADRSLVCVEPEGADAFRGFPPIDIGKISARGFVPMKLDQGLQSTVESLGHGS